MEPRDEITKNNHFMRTTKLLLSLVAAAIALQLSAAPVDLATALQKAQKCMTEQVFNGKVMASNATTPVLIKTEMGKVNKQTPVYYIFNTNTNYIIVSGDDRAEDILAIGDRPLNLDRMPENMKEWLGVYREEIDYLLSNPALKVDKPSIQKAPSLNAVTGTYGPLLTAQWDQTAPYWNQCKFTYNGTTYQCYTGCPATSASMVLYYWKYPTTAVAALPSYSGQLDISSSRSVSFTYPALASTTFDWANMKDTYSSYTTAQGTAVATLMRYVGQAEHMMYGTESAGGSGIYTTDAQNVADMFILFGYDSSTCRLAKKSSYTATNWANLLQEEMAAGRPVVYMAVSSSAGGHAFNVDGFRSSDTKYHVNFGWSGDGDAWCSMNSFGYSGYTFNSDQQMILGIQPPQATGPTITADPTSLSFSGVIGNTYTKTVTVTGANLEGNITVTKSGNAAYTIDKTSITRGSDGSASATITVTYKPTATGNTTATLTLKSSNADNVTVNISGTATAPTITATPSSVSFSCETGETKTQVVTIKGSNLTGNVAATLSGGNGYYTIDKSAISAATANSTNGGTITITYKPTAAGNTNATLTLKSANAADVVVNISGSASVPVPTITTSATSIAFGSNYTNVASTKTFTVTGRNLTEAIQATLTDANGVYTLSSTSISATEAANGKTITVTFNPKAAQTYNGTIKLTTAGANQVTINLSGTGQLLKVVPVMQAADENYIKHTSFRADWTDETPAANVASYTLEVSTKSAQPEPVSGGVADFSDIEAVVNDEGSLPNCASTASDYLPDGWTAENYLYINDGFVITGASSSWYSTTYGAVVSPTLDLTGNDKVTVVAKVKSYYPSYYGQATVRLLTGSAYKDFTLGSSDDDDFQTITAVLDCSSTDQVKVQARANYFALQDVKIYAGDITDTSANAPRRAAVEQGDSTMRTITGITDKFYTVKDLTGGGMFNFKVKAIYTDNTESQWSNIELVTLSQTPDTSWLMGDVNLDGKVDVQDVNILVNILLGTDQASNYDGRADVDGNGKVDVADINTVINIMLGNNATRAQKKHTKFYLLDLSTEQK